MIVIPIIIFFIILACHRLFDQDNDDLLASSGRGIAEESEEDEGGQKQENIPYLAINFTFTTLFVISSNSKTPLDQDYQGQWLRKY